MTIRMWMLGYHFEWPIRIYKNNKSITMCVSFRLPHLYPMRRSETLPDAEVNLTAMIDLVFFLLIFFMTSSTMAKGARAGAPVVLPDSTQAPATKDGLRRIEVIVRGESEVLVAGKPVGSGKLPELLRGEAGGAKDKPRVLIRAERTVPFEQVRAVLQAAASAGLPDVQFATVDGGAR